MTLFLHFHFQLAIVFDERIMLSPSYAYRPNRICPEITISIGAAFIINWRLFLVIEIEGR